MSKAGIEFPFVNLGTLDVAQLPELYNRCAVALLLSLTSVSLLPLEVLACGVVPVVNDADNTRISLDNNPGIDFVVTSPSLMADHIIAALDRPDDIEHSRELAASMAGGSWAGPGKKVVEIFDSVIGRTPQGG
jgi:hypothetical protein